MISKPSEAPNSEKDRQPDRDRRSFLKVAVTASVLLVAAAIGAAVRSIINPVPQPPAGISSFSRVKVANIADLNVNEPVVFNYPLDNEPNILVKLGRRAQDGAGPDGDIVAFSQICQHLGCIYSFQSAGNSPQCNPSFKALGPIGYCCCHGSVFDFMKGAAVVTGPSPRPQPQVILDIDSLGDIYAVGMRPPTVFGHCTGSDDVSCDLQGGTPVG